MKYKTYIAGLLDRSGSMNSIKDDTIGGINQFIKEQKDVGNDCLLTLSQFDSRGVEIIYESMPIKDVPDLTDKVYKPRGGTPLLYAIGQTIESTGRALAAIPEENRPDNVVFIIITDGQENESHLMSPLYTKEQIASMINLQEVKYSWNFIYLGANVDAFDESSKINIHAQTAANFTPKSAFVGTVYSNLSSNVSSYRNSGLKSDLNWTSVQRNTMTNEDK